MHCLDRFWCVPAAAKLPHVVLSARHWPRWPPTFGGHYWPLQILRSRIITVRNNSSTLLLAYWCINKRWCCAELAAYLISWLTGPMYHHCRTRKNYLLNDVFSLKYRIDFHQLESLCPWDGPVVRVQGVLVPVDVEAGVFWGQEHLAGRPFVVTFIVHLGCTVSFSLKFILATLHFNWGQRRQGRAAIQQSNHFDHYNQEYCQHWSFGTKTIIFTRINVMIFGVKPHPLIKR